jgi:hypothetical protein
MNKPVPGWVIAPVFISVPLIFAVGAIRAAQRFRTSEERTGPDLQDGWELAGEALYVTGFLAVVLLLARGFPFWAALLLGIPLGFAAAWLFPLSLAFLLYSCEWVMRRLRPRE